MSTITCNSCGMQYDGSGLQPGVQFQCTQCGAMVVVGAASPPPQRGQARPRGGPPGRGPGRGPVRGPARGPQPMAGGPQQQMQDRQQMPYGPPKSGSNAGLFVGIGVGLVVLVLIVVVVVASSGPSPEEARRQKMEEEAAKQREDAAKRDEETRKANEAILKPQEAAMAQAADVFNALKNEDAATLETMFDWQTYAAYNKSLLNDPENGKDYQNLPLFVTGTWEKDDTGKYTGAFVGNTAHSSESLKQRVMGYLKEFVFGAEGLEWDRTKTESKDGNFTLELNGTTYYGKRIIFTYKTATKPKELWLVAPAGSDQVRIVNYYDNSSIKNLQTTEAKNERTDDRRDPYNPDRAPRDPDRDPPKDPDNPDEPPLDPDANLPEVAKTGAMPTAPALLNAVDELKRGGDLNSARTRAVEGEVSKKQKKDTMGAFIDLLIDAHKNSNRTMKLRISSALWEIWRPFVPPDWGKDDMVYTLDNFGTQSNLDIHIRRWLEVYNLYPLD